MAENEINEGSDEIRISDRTERTSKHTADEAVSDSERAEGYEQRFTTFSDNDEDQSFKAIQPAADSFGIDFGDGTVETAKGKVAKPHTQEFFEAKAQGAMTAMQNLDKQPKYQPDQLIAANVTPNNPVMSDATLPNTKRTDDPTPSESTVAWGEDKLIPRVAMPSPGDRAAFPYRGFEDQLLSKCTEENPKAWNDAIAAFPELHGTGFTSEHLMAVVRNELHFYDPKDILDDSLAKAGQKLTGTLGFSQVAPKGIGEFNRDVPEFNAWLKEKGYKIPGDEQKVLENPCCVPMIAAAKMASLVKNYESHNRNHPDRPVDIYPESLIYGYNADVQRLTQNGKITYESMTDPDATIRRKLGYDLEKVYPTSDPEVLGTSNHLKNVLRQLDEIRHKN